NLHGDEVLTNCAAADAVIVEHRAQKIPEFALAVFTSAIPAAPLLVERVQELLTGRRAGEGGPLKQRAAEATTIEVAFGSAIEGDAEAGHEVDDFRPPIGHFLHRRLMR